MGFHGFIEELLKHLRLRLPAASCNVRYAVTGFMEQFPPVKGENFACDNELDVGHDGISSLLDKINVGH